MSTGKAQGSGTAVYVISVAAELSGMHAQTLRTYDRMGLVSPARTRGGGRRYSDRDIELLRKIQALSQDDGVNLAGIKSIIELTEERDQLEAERDALAEEVRVLRDQLAAGQRVGVQNPHAQVQNPHAQSPHTPGRSQRSSELVHVPRSTSVVMWSPRTARDRKRNRRNHGG
ncbi:MerR family transcriptional regulator [Corynebacterium macginleyi]|uniref:Helix-turn-helix transcriptional regulator n=1 Tax=Corynebacterium macginleyi TaxID=38290 RepID=A0A3M0GMD9_9CORY|nr:helix-turn-helix transcriptional regulator [Corynebacterium macginleyi]MBK4139059.1 MerR family transcriptional regulator [Corynebacterium macginleyi]MBK4153726.1 MerR family transcriptional regulator [Corynebacterium macginleyi]MBK4156745.1 MerR family transcriptional regulator [Corynebacterium macginleyi]MBK4165181.1 MerR family transcriptional regulator [Corynebacterium macginleyi]MBK4174500.1 MerR family transcriptional regulator [Corynebacterium macginleyi]